MYAISIRQPWAYAILFLGKDVENRKWKTNFRGRVLIHASKRFDNEGWEYILERFPNFSGILAAQKDIAPMGGIVGSVEITDCTNENIKSDWWAGSPNYGFVLKDPKTCKFFPYKGRLGIFEVPEIEGE